MVKNLEKKLIIKKIEHVLYVELTNYFGKNIEDYLNYFSNSTILFIKESIDFSNKPLK